MIEIDLSNSDLFKNLTEIDYSGGHIDLHNSYSCRNILFSKEKEELCLKFNSIDNKSFYNSVFIVLKSVELTFMDFSFENIITDLTLDNFYRGRFEERGTLLERSGDSKSYYYFEFYEGFKIEIFAKQLIFQIS